MRKIISIQFVNYKAFFGEGEQNLITIPNGNNLLIYGENGSGKSSIYEGLKQFFNSADNTLEVIPSRHIAFSKTRLVNEGTDDEKEEINEVSVKVIFQNEHGVNDERIFGVPTETVRGTNYIGNANLLNSFLSYRELLRTYLMDNVKDRKEFRKKFALLLVETILAKNRNTVTQKSYVKSWEDLFIPKVWYKEYTLTRFIQGLEYDINRINLILNEILKYFEPDLEVQLKLTFAEIQYIHLEREDREGKYPVCEVDLIVKLFGEEVENDEENHLTVLNEARLSALGISIYFASLINTLQDGFQYKILFLDDIFIGLDMSNRLPLLQILTQFKKPIIEKYVDDVTHQVIERILEVDGVKQYEENLFFNSYQIFVTTYDRYWFEVAKDWFENKAKDRWQFLELYANKTPDLTFNTPVVYNSLDYLQKANFYFSKHDYPTCVNYLRKALEKRIKKLLPANLHFAEALDSETGVTEIKKLKNLHQYIDKFILFCDANGIDSTEISVLKNLKDWYFNPFSHDNIGTPVYKKEVEIAKAHVEKFYQLTIEELAPAGTNLFFRFSNDAGDTREYKITLSENIRHIISNDENILTDARMNCYEWARNGTVDNPTWGETKLFHFYNNKKNHFFHTPDEQVDKSVFWDVIYFQDSELPLNSILI